MVHLCKVMYTPKEFNTISIPALKQEQIKTHLGLYNGYVTNLNALLECIQTTKDGKVKGELLRRVGFEWNGMRNHELYFEAVSGTPSRPAGDTLPALIDKTFSSFERCCEDIQSIALSTRGPGWALLGYDTSTDTLLTAWIADHELGMPVTVVPLLLIDMWEHAYFYEGVGTEKKAYVDSYLESVDWSIVEARL